MRPDFVHDTPLGPLSNIPSGAAAVASLVEDLSVFYDDGGNGLQHVVARIPLLLEVDRSYVARISSDQIRFTVTQTSQGEFPDLLGYTQSISRLPAFVRGSLQSGVQAVVEDSKLFPFTPQQRKMTWYTDLGATVVTPIRSMRNVVGALIIDVFKEQRTWDRTLLETCKALADAVGARLALAQLGDHLASDERDPAHDMHRLNVLANIARHLQRADDPESTMSEIVEELRALNGVKSVRMAALDDASEVVREALATEDVVVRNKGDVSLVALPMLFEGERFKALELELDSARLSDVEEQFLRTVRVFAGSTYAAALRRAKPRNEALVDALTELMSYRAIHELLEEEVRHSKSGNRPVSVWLVDVEGLDTINRGQGYAVGDDVVSFVGHSLGQAVQPRGTAGRVGGGMFLVVLPSMAGEEAETGARMLVERIGRKAPGHLPFVKLAIGIASLPANALTHEDLERTARLALYLAKSNAKNRVVLARTDDNRWMNAAQGAFVRIVSEQQLPASMRTAL